MKRITTKPLALAAATVRPLAAAALPLVDGGALKPIATRTCMTTGC